MPSSLDQITPEPVATNTLIIANLERTIFSGKNLEQLRAQVAQYGTLYKFIPISCLNRVLAIFYCSTEAQAAKAFMDKTIFLDKIIRVYFWMHTPINDTVDESQHLSVPQIEKNWLISPPGSPPVGWTQIREEAPNSNTLAGDLSHALARVAGTCPFTANTHNDDDDLDGFSLDGPSEDNTGTLKREYIPKIQVPVLTVISSNADLEGGYNVSSDFQSVPMILVQDWDCDWSPPTNHPQLPTNTRNIQTKAQLQPILAQRPPTPTPCPPTILKTPRPPL